MSSDKEVRMLGMRVFGTLLLFLFSVQVLGQAPVASFSMNQNQGCLPLIVAFTQNSTNAVSYSWNFGNGNTSSDPNPTNVFNTPGTYSVSLTVGNGSGTSTFSLPVTVYPSPAPDFSVAQTSGCQGADIFQFTNLSTGFDSCIWDFGDGNISYDLNPLHIYDTSGVFKVKLLVINSQTGCQQFIEKSNLITVYPTPRAQLIVNDTSTCNQQHQFAFQLINSTNLLSWNWHFGDGSTASNTSNTYHVYADTGYYDISVVMVSQMGCTDTTIYADYIHVLHNPIPILSVQPVTGCQPLNVSFDVINKAPGNYQWNTGAGIIKTGASVYHQYADSGAYSVGMNVTYDNGCQRSLRSSQILVKGHPDFTYNMSNFSGCAPLTVNFINHNAGANYSWLWDFGDGNTSSLASPLTHTYTSPGNYTVYLNAVSANGCDYGYPLSGKVTVFGAEAAFSSDVTSGCPPFTVNFTNNSLNASLYQWDFGDGSTSNAIHPTHVFDSTGNYTIRLIAIDTVHSCIDTLVLQNYIQVAVPSANYQTSPPVTGCAPFPVNFSDASGASSFIWDFGDGNSSTLANPHHVYSVPGVYTVSLTTTYSNGGCPQFIQNFQTFNIDASNPGFTYTVSECPPYVVQFTDTSSNAVAWDWDFGSGITSNQQNPAHVFSGTGSHNVTLVSTSANGCQTTLHANGVVQITGLGAHANAVCSDTIAPFQVQFQANSTNATWWFWDFGDGYVDSSENPLHTFTGNGPFHITLTVGNDSCSYTYDYPPVSFGNSNGAPGSLSDTLIYVPLENHCAPYTVNFTNPDPSAISIVWNFGDGNFSTSFSPSHTYSLSGLYIPELYLTRSNGDIDTLILPDTIIVVNAITDFQVVSTSLCTGVRVDVSPLYPAVSYQWDFGNGTTFSSANAGVTYPNINASYSVSLNVVDSNGCSSFIAKSFVVKASGSLTSSKRRACSGDSIEFDPGNVFFSNYLWDFGDGTFSLSRTPTHVYTSRGLFQVTLTATDINGCQRTFSLPHPIQIFKPEANFTVLPPVSHYSCTFIKAGFSNQSTGSSTWVWDFGDGNYSNLQNPDHNYYNSGTYNVTLTAYENVCSSTFTVPAAASVVSLHADFSISVADNCSPVQAQFTDLSNDAVSWLWDFGDGNTSTLQHPQHIYSSQPADSVSLKISDINGCVKSIRMPSPAVTKAGLSVSTSGGCSPLLVQFNDLSTNAASWNWEFGNGTIDTISSPSQVFSGDGFYSVRLIVGSSTGCYDTLFVDSLIEVNTPVANFSLDTLTGCAPLFVNYTSNSLNSSFYSWDFMNGTVSAVENPSQIYALPGTYSTKLMVTNKFGCTDSVIMDSVLLVRGPQPQFTIDNPNGCSPFSVSFTNNTSSQYSFQWYFGDGRIDSIYQPQHIYSDTGTFSVSLFAMDSTGCSSVYTQSNQVHVSASPVAGFIVSGLNGCAPHTVSITDTTMFADSLIWDMGDGTVLNGNITSYTYSVPGIYKIFLKTVNREGCSDSLMMTDSIVVNEVPVADFTASITEGCPPLNVTVISNSSQLDNPTFLWSNGIVQSADSITDFVFDQSGYFNMNLIVVNEGGCSDTISRSNFIHVYDTASPAPVSIRRVTVQNDSVILLEWLPLSGQETDHYLIYRLNQSSGLFDSVGIVSAQPPASGTFFTYVDFGILADLYSYSYKVIGVNRCGFRLSPDSVTSHTTILLSAQPGHHQVFLSWTDYNGCNPSGYQIFRKDINGAPLVPIGQVGPGMLTFVDSSVFCPFDYVYVVKAIGLCGNNSVVSYSNSVNARPFTDIFDQQADIVRSTVVDNRYVLTEWNSTSVLPFTVSGYDVYRTSDGIHYYPIAYVPLGVNYYEDYQVDVNWNRYLYKIVIKNICNTDTRDGLPGSSILLSSMEWGGTNKLNWSEYIQWDSGVDYYKLEKQDDQGRWIQEATVPSGITDWVVE